MTSIIGQFLFVDLILFIKSFEPSSTICLPHIITSYFLVSNICSLCLMLEASDTTASLSSDMIYVFSSNIEDFESWIIRILVIIKIPFY